MTEYSYDNHTLFVKVDCANVNQITKCFRDMLDEYNKKNTPSDCRFRVNLVESKDGKSYNIAFVFLTDSKIYNMILGKNPDGSDRIEYIDDPSWEPPTEGNISNDLGWVSPQFKLSDNWADICEAEEEENAKIQLNIRPKIMIRKESLIKLPPFTLTEDQVNSKKQKIIEENSGKDHFDEKLIDIPKISYLSVDRAIAAPVDNKFMPNILKAKNVPIWITKDMIKGQFVPYAEDSKTVQDRYIRGHKVTETYPFVNINEDRVAFVIFNPSSHDAQFALHMMKKAIFIKGNNHVTLLFCHSFRSDRDLMATINQQPRKKKTRSDIVTVINKPK